MMFGDAGHAVIMLLFAFWMVKKEKQLGAEKSDNEVSLIITFATIYFFFIFNKPSNISTFLHIYMYSKFTGI